MTLSRGGRSLSRQQLSRSRLIAQLFNGVPSCGVLPAKTDDSCAHCAQPRSWFQVGVTGWVTGARARRVACRVASLKHEQYRCRIGSVQPGIDRAEDSRQPCSIAAMEPELMSRGSKRFGSSAEARLGKARNVSIIPSRQARFPMRFGSTPFTAVGCLPAIGSEGWRNPPARCNEAVHRVETTIWRGRRRGSAGACPIAPRRVTPRPPTHRPSPSHAVPRDAAPRDAVRQPNGSATRSP